MHNLATLSVTVLSAILMPVAGFAGEWKDALKSSLESNYVLSKRATLSPDRITNQGTVLVVRKEGITADLSSDMRYSVTKVKDGSLAEQGGAVSALFTKQRSRVFKVGERVYLTDLDVYDDGVLLKVITCDMFDVSEKGSTKQRRYKAAIKFEYAKDAMPKMESSQLKKDMETVLIPESEVAASTKTIALGQTRQEVEEILGKPERIVDLGQKVTYVYKDMKVVFVDGKVADVQ